ncbi:MULTISPECIES: hypothetical protein [Acidiplasma]|nr:MULTISPECIES: hypothetical protein [Acidiplasma]WMT54284.1 MAG: hypothetical protein RE470_05050 [Acidiplasma sp.]
MNTARYYFTQKYQMLQTTKDNLISLFNKFLHENYGDFLFIDPDSIETLGKINAYADLFLPEHVLSIHLINKIGHVFYLEAENIYGYITIKGPEFNSALMQIKSKIAELNKSYILKIISYAGNYLAKIPEIRMAYTPMMEIFRSLDNNGNVILDTSRQADTKRIKFFSLIKHSGILKYEERYDKIIIYKNEDPGFKNDREMFAMTFSAIPEIFAANDSVKPYVRTAYSYYYFSIIHGDMIPLDAEILLRNYRHLFNRNIDELKFRSYIDSLIDCGIFFLEDGKIKGNIEIYNKIKN